MVFMRHNSSFLLPSIPSNAINDSTDLKYALVVLNQSIPRYTPLLLEHDGGANRVFDEMPLLFPDENADQIRNRYLPHVIKGDMDSIRKEVLEFYMAKGTRAVDESHDHDTTDLHKCIKYIHDIIPD